MCLFIQYALCKADYGFSWWKKKVYGKSWERTCYFVLEDMPKTPLKKYVNINGKVSKDKWQSMFRYFAKYVKTLFSGRLPSVPTLFLYCPDLLSDNMGKYENKRLISTAYFRLKSGLLDSNQRPRAPQTCALPTAPNPEHCGCKGKDYFSTVQTFCLLFCKKKYFKQNQHLC